MSNLFSNFQENFPDDLDSQFLVTSKGRQVSYLELNDASARIANCLLESGASPGDRVTVQVEKSVESIFLYLACLRSGLVYHPLNTAYKSSELSFFIENAEPTIVVCSTEAIDTYKSIVSKEGIKTFLTLDSDGSGTLMQEAARFSNNCETKQCKGSETAALLYSSGTTGQPKGIVLSHDNLLKNGETLVNTWGFSSSDRLLHMLPIYHVHGLFVGLNTIFLSGASMIWCEDFNAEEAIENLPDCTVMMGVPTYYTRLLSNSKLSKECCSNMRLFISGSAPLLKETFDNFQDKTGHTILERYGMTETGMNTSNPLNGERRAGTVGLPLSGVTVRVVDESGEGMATYETGDIQIKGPNVFSGYWRMPDKSAEDFTEDGFFNTGDKGTIDSDGYVSIVGREKDMIITGGLNVYPKEIELIIDEIYGVKESAVVGVADLDFGEAVIAVIVSDGSILNEEKITSFCKVQLANFKVPKRIYFVEDLPRNAMGKIQKNLLRERFKTELD
jgi:malonyl-CoA/methylmalonyl-CoA synthetase|tara:strand:- start:433 stop:1941 length:1509 start_codon:yes stop_codon:yes gene_type:complete